VLLSSSKSPLVPGRILSADYIELLERVPADANRKEAQNVNFNGVDYYVAHVPMDAPQTTPIRHWQYVALLPHSVVLGGLEQSLYRSAAPVLALLVVVVVTALAFSGS